MFQGLPIWKYGHFTARLEGKAKLTLLRWLTGRRPDTAQRLDDAARAYLGGDTAAANALVARARQDDAAYFDTLSAETAPLQAELAGARLAGTVQRLEDSDHYTNDHVRVYWESARREFETRSPHENANALVYSIYTRKIAEAIAQLQPSAVLDFGCACGLPLARLGARFPSVRFRGIDRQVVLRDLNAAHFEQPNVRFEAGDVMDFLPRFEPRAERKMLVHVRTGIMVYSAFLERLYALAASHGVSFVALYEIASLSCVSWTFRDQGSGFEAEAHRSTMFIHDYAAALRRAGFTPITIERMPHGYSLAKNNMLPGDTYTFVLARV